MHEWLKFDKVFHGSYLHILFILLVVMAWLYQMFSLKINYKGYGNTIYLKLNDGNTAVYAHLDTFYPELDEITNIIKKNEDVYY